MNENINGSISFDPARLPDGRILSLEVEGIRVDPREKFGRFLEHVYDRVQRRHTDQLISCIGDRLYISDDLGESWKSIAVPLGNPTTRSIWASFTTPKTHLIVVRENRRKIRRGDSYEQDAAAILVYDRKWNLIKTIEKPGYIWLGNHAIDQSGDVIMYGEYPLDSENGLSIRRSLDGGLTWEEALRVPSSAQAGRFPDEELVRHFHTCEADPWIPGRWYATNGDAFTPLWKLEWRYFNPMQLMEAMKEANIPPSKEICPIRLSDDGGETWMRCKHHITNLDDFPPASHDILKRAIMRTTATIIERDAIYAITDDRFQYISKKKDDFEYVGALLVRATKNAPYEITVLANFGKKLMRACIKIDDHYYLAISQSDKFSPALNVFVFNLHGWSRLVGFVPVTSGINDGPGSAYSFAVKNNIFFTYGEHIVFDNGETASCPLKWKVTFSEESDRNSVGFSSCPPKKEFLMNASLFYTDQNFPGCTICGGTNFENYGEGEGKRCCCSCRSLERHRTFATIYEKYLRHEFALTKEPMLHFAPGTSEIRMLGRIDGLKRITADLQTSYNPDLIIDACDMGKIPDNVFGSVFASAVLEWVHDDVAALSEIHRVLNEGGRFFFSPGGMHYGKPTQYQSTPTKRCDEDHRVAFYRQYGDLDLIRLFQDFFVVKTYYAFDAPTETIQTWYCGIKSKNRIPKHPPGRIADTDTIDIREILEQKKLWHPLEIIDISCDGKSGVSSGESVTWTCDARCGKNDAMEYAWYVFKDDQRVEVIWYQPENNLTYVPREPGKYKIQVYVQNKKEKLSAFSAELNVV